MSSVASGGRLVARTPMRDAIARRMTASKREAPHFYVSIELELDDTLAQLEQLNEGLPEEERISVTAAVVRATALALREHPALNAVWTDEGLAVVDPINVAVAIALDGGLIAPALQRCETLDLRQTAAALRDLVARARAGKLRSSELTDGTFTFSNLGMFDVSQFTAIVTPPQIAILALGKVTHLPRYDDGGNIVPRAIATATASADHRALDGVDVARFLSTLRALLRSGAARP